MAAEIHGTNSAARRPGTRNRNRGATRRRQRRPTSRTRNRWRNAYLRLLQKPLRRRRRVNTDAAQINWSDDTDGFPLIFADLAATTGVTINTLREAWLVQTLLERDARGGTRYVELIRSHFGVTNPDFRLQRPEYIGGGQTPLYTTPVAQTAPGDDGSVGALGGATTAAGQHTASYAATEHGFIIGLINVRTELSYSQGQARMWNRSTRFDYYWPALAGLGEQAIERREIYARGEPDDSVVFGYQERWHEYRTRYSEITGLFRPSSAGAIDQWHLSQRFLAFPTLGNTFIQDTPQWGAYSRQATLRSANNTWETFSLTEQRSGRYRCSEHQ